MELYNRLPNALKIYITVDLNFDRKDFYFFQNYFLDLIILLLNFVVNNLFTLWKNNIIINIIIIIISILDKPSPQYIRPSCNSTFQTNFIEYFISTRIFSKKLVKPTLSITHSNDFRWHKRSLTVIFSNRTIHKKVL